MTDTNCMETVKTRRNGAVSIMNERPSMIPPSPAEARSTTNVAHASALAPPAPSPQNLGRPAPAAPPAPPLTLVLDDLVSSVEGLHGALLASVDGFAIARSNTMPNTAAHAALLAASMGLAHQLADMGGGNQLRQLVVDHDEGLLLLWPIGTARVLSLLTARRVDQSQMRRLVQTKATWLAGESA